MGDWGDWDWGRYWNWGGWDWGETEMRETGIGGETGIGEMDWGKLG